MFEPGDYVVYHRIGICRVLEIKPMNLEGLPEDRLYYVLQKNGKTDGMIYTPVESRKQVLRPMMSKTEVTALLKELPDLETLQVKNEREREEIYKNSLRGMDGEETLRLLKTLYLRKRTRLDTGRKVTALDERYRKLAEDNLFAELSILLEIPLKEVGTYIQEKIQSRTAS